MREGYGRLPMQRNLKFVFPAVSCSLAVKLLATCFQPTRNVIMETLVEITDLLNVLYIVRCSELNNTLEPVIWLFLLSI